MNRPASVEYVSYYSSQLPHINRTQKTGGEESSYNKDDFFVLDDYDSDEESKQSNSSGPHLTDLGLSKETQNLMTKLGLTAHKDVSMDEEVDDDGPKIFYCSRTHSQLSQFAAELRRVKLPPVLDPDPALQTQNSTFPKQSETGSASRSKSSLQEHDMNLFEAVKHLTLGSRKNLCINPQVNKLSSLTAINEKCMELQKSGTAADHKCTFLPNKENESVASQFRDHAVAKIRDIEELGNLGKTMGICPYYASRPAIDVSEVRNYGGEFHRVLIHSRSSLFHILFFFKSLLAKRSEYL
jgi:chromosome transmission fidelity protein 1